jgi:hypothetical protein
MWHCGITGLLAHFDDLSRAHAAVLRAKGSGGSCSRPWWQIAISTAIERGRVAPCREALKPLIASRKRVLLTSAWKTLHINS